jgi:hypothetical protein
MEPKSVRRGWSCLRRRTPIEPRLACRGAHTNVDPPRRGTGNREVRTRSVEGYAGDALVGLAHKEEVLVVAAGKPRRSGGLTLIWVLCACWDCECLLMTWIEMEFLSTSLCDVTAPSQFHTTVVRQKTTALGYEASSASLSPVQALASSKVDLHELLKSEYGRKNEKRPEWGPQLGSKCPPRCGACRGRRRRQN